MYRVGTLIHRFPDKFLTDKAHCFMGSVQPLNCSVNKQPAKFNISRQFLEKTKAKLDAFLQHIVPEEQFRVFTFEHDDYAGQKLTLLLFDLVPAHVFVTVPACYNLSKAVEEVKLLNPGIQFEKVPIDDTDQSVAFPKRQTQELKIVYLPLRVDMDGKLVQ
jgi:hypothetical protein